MQAHSFRIVSGLICGLAATRVELATSSAPAVAAAPRSSVSRHGVWSMMLPYDRNLTPESTPPTRCERNRPWATEVGGVTSNAAEDKALELALRRVATLYADDVLACRLPSLPPVLVGGMSGSTHCHQPPDWVSHGKTNAHAHLHRFACVHRAPPTFLWIVANALPEPSITHPSPTR